MNPIYLDYNATTPIDPEVAAAMRPFLDNYWGNPSSLHPYGRAARLAIHRARAQVAHLLGCQSDEIVFTSGGSEANNFALKGVAFARPERGGHIITTQIEHPAVSEVCHFLAANGFAVTRVPVDGSGRVDAGDVARAIRPDTFLISVMHANNEVGTIQPISQIAEIARQHGILLHSDAAQTVGKIRTHVNELKVDLLSIAGHKFYAHKGIGALFIRRGIKLQSLIHGAGHEQNRRAGTENTLQIVGLGKACEIAGRDLQKNQAHLCALRDQLWTALQASLEDVYLNGHPVHRLPNTLNISFGGCIAHELLAHLTQIAASAGAACHAGETRISATLTAMKIPLERARGAIRFSVGKFTTPVEIEQAVDAIVKTVRSLRENKPPLAARPE